MLPWPDWVSFVSPYKTIKLQVIERSRLGILLSKLLDSKIKCVLIRGDLPDDPTYSSRNGWGNYN